MGNFDIGGDTILETPKQSVIHLYACLANKFDLSVDTEHVVYHHWYSSEGVEIVDFKTGKSISKLSPSKSCPGTNFWGDGNTVAAANKRFIPDVKAELERLRKAVVTTPIKETIKDDDQVEKVKDVLTKDNSVHNGFMKDNENFVPVVY